MDPTRGTARRRDSQPAESADDDMTLDGPAARRATQRLRRRLVDLPVEALLGTEQSLMTDLGLSRGALRLVMRTLAAEGLVRLRRGKKAGYVVCRPDEATVIGTAAMFLRSQQVTILDAMAVIAPLLIHAARLAAACEDAALRGRLRVIVEEIAIFDPRRDPPSLLLRGSTEFMNCLLAMAGNPMLALYVHCATQLGLIEASAGMASDVELTSVRQKSVLLLGEALLRGDAEVAVLVQERQMQALEDAMRTYHRQRQATARDA